MSVECDIRDAASLSRPEPTAADLRTGRGRTTPAFDLRTAARSRDDEPNAFTGTAAVLRAPITAAGELVERAMASVATATRAAGGAPVDFVPDPEVHHTSAGTAIVHLHQHHRGIPIYEAVRSVRLDLGARLAEIVGDHVAIPGEIDVLPAISPADGVMAAARYLADSGAEASLDATPLEVSGFAPRLIASFPLPSRPSVLSKRPFSEPVTAQLVLFYCASEDIRLGWLVSLTTPGNHEQYDLIVGAHGDHRAEILYCKGSFTSARGRGSVFRHSPGDPEGRVELDLPLPRAAYPALTALGPTDPFGRPWIADDRTRGNNAAAFRGNRRRAALEGINENGTVVFRPTDPEGEDQCLLNAFYYCNYLHDFFALLGFGEAEGNFQRHNFSDVPGDRDELEVRVFPGPVAGTARMRSRRDGKRGRLLLGLRDDRHSALDADLVYHEYTHGVSNRLVGGRLNFEPLRHPESRALGEGYSDYFALTIQSHQLGREKTVFGAWLADDEEKGLRRQAYDDAFGLHFGDLNDPENQQPHNGGEIWCAALVRMNRAIGRALDDAEQGHEIGWQLVVDSLKLLPVGPDKPGFLDGRDAITRALTDLGAAGRLDAAAAVEGAVLEAFAKTGMGPLARGRGARFQDIVPDFTGSDSTNDTGGTS